MYITEIIRHFKFWFENQCNLRTSSATSNVIFNMERNSEKFQHYYLSKNSKSERQNSVCALKICVTQYVWHDVASVCQLFNLISLFGKIWIQSRKQVMNFINNCNKSWNNQWVALFLRIPYTASELRVVWYKRILFRQRTSQNCLRMRDRLYERQSGYHIYSNKSPLSYTPSNFDVEKKWPNAKYKNIFFGPFFSLRVSV